MGYYILRILKAKQQHIRKFKKWWFDPNPILVNINKLKPYGFLHSTFKE
jgi:hypothetical protein